MELVTHSILSQEQQQQQQQVTAPEPLTSTPKDVTLICLLLIPDRRRLFSLIHDRHQIEFRLLLTITSIQSPGER